MNMVIYGVALMVLGAASLILLVRAHRRTQREEDAYLRFLDSRARYEAAWDQWPTNWRRPSYDEGENIARRADG